MKRKVLFVITKSNWGGAQRYVYDLATSLPPGEFEPVVAFGGTGVADARAGALQEKLHAAGVRTIFIPSLMRDISLMKEIGSFFDLLRIFKTEKPDIVHLNSSKAGGLGALAARLAHVPRIFFTAHGWPFLEDRGSVARGIIFFFSWVTVLLSHRTICVSDNDLQNGLSMPRVGNKMLMIHNGVPPLELLSRVAARKELGLPSDTFVIGAIGELTRNKNFEQLIEAASKLKEETEKDFVLDLIGDGEQKHSINKLFQDRNFIEGRDVMPLGFKKDAYQYLSAFDIFLLPSLKEGLPYVLLEAGQAGLAVVASRVGGIPEVIEDGVTGLLINPKHVYEITEALKKYITDPSLRAGMGSRLQHKVEKEFSLTDMIEKTSAVYRS